MLICPFLTINGGLQNDIPDKDMISDSKKTIFISYRWNNGEPPAKAIYSDLEKKGYDVFIDRKDLGAGKFMLELERQIKAREIFVPILTTDFWKYPQGSKKTMLKEIEWALESDKMIIPVFYNGFEFPADNELPVEIEELKAYNFVDYPLENSELCVKNLIKLMDKVTQVVCYNQSSSRDYSKPHYSISRGLISSGVEKNPGIMVPSLFKDDFANGILRVSIDRKWLSEFSGMNYGLNVTSCKKFY